MKPKLLVLALSLILIILPALAQRAEKTARVHGRVTTLWGRPVKNAHIAFYKLVGISGNSPTEKLIRQLETDKDGNYDVEVPWGQYRVEAKLSGFGHTEIWRFYLGEDDDRVLDIGMPNGNWQIVRQMKVAGSVTQPDGKVVADATVTMIPAYSYNEPQAFVSDQARTDAQGRYEFTSMEVGDFVVYVAKPGFFPGSMAFRLHNGEKKTVDIELKAAPEFNMLTRPNQ